MRTPISLAASCVALSAALSVGACTQHALVDTVMSSAYRPDVQYKPS
jgi:hypothetical protein